MVDINKDITQELSHEVEIDEEIQLDYSTPFVAA
jgi:hypothetical protein